MAETELFSRDKIVGAITELSGKMRLPLAFIDMEGNYFTSGDDPRGQEESLHGDEHSLRRVPVYLGREMVGFVACGDGTAQGEAILNAAAVSLEMLFRLEKEIEDLSAEIVRVYEELSLIYSLSSKLGAELDIATICLQVVEEINRVLGVKTILLMLLDEKSGTLSIQYCTEKVRERVETMRVASSAEPFAQIFARKKCVVIPEGEAATGFPLPFKEALWVPLVTDNRNIGMLIAADKVNGKEFRSQEIKLIDALSGEIAAAIKKAQLYERIKKLFMSTVEALASAIDAKDPYTYGHSRRVAHISEAICRELGLPGEEIQFIELAALLHDIGKIGTPERILQKPGRLQPKEMEVIKEHPLQGAHILSTIDELQEVMAWIRQHHERYDGRGYPGKVTAEDIPLPARIIAIADSYDAMTSDRPYRKAMNPGKVMDIMDDLAGSQFDPHVFKAFKSVFLRRGARMTCEEDGVR